LVYKGDKSGLVGIFRACKKIQAVSNSRDFKQEYIMLRKRAKSQSNKPREHLVLREDENIEELLNETRKSDNSKRGTIRSKSIESKRKQLLG
jgi:hypothetical protein